MSDPELQTATEEVVTLQTSAWLTKGSKLSLTDMRKFVESTKGWDGDVLLNIEVSDEKEDEYSVEIELTMTGSPSVPTVTPHLHFPPGIRGGGMQVADKSLTTTNDDVKRDAAGFPIGPDGLVEGPGGQRLKPHEAPRSENPSYGPRTKRR